jgi:RNA polymerase sigma-70 factor (ECF subfamily)
MGIQMKSHVAGMSGSTNNASRKKHRFNENAFDARGRAYSLCVDIGMSMSESETVSSRLPMEGEAISAAGEIPAFVEAVTIHQSLVFSIAYHLLHNRSLAEEVAQDVFLRLYRDYDKIESASHLIHWLRRITTHRCLDRLRSLEKRRQVSLDEVEIALPSSASEQDPILARTLRRLVSDLPAAARAVVVLRYQEDLEPREIARILDLPVNTVKSRLQRALTQLRTQLAALEESRHESN